MINKFKKVITHKNSGNTTSLLIGQMFIFILIILSMFNFRSMMLNAVFNYIDDALTTSCLAAALVNVEEYGKSNQLIIHDNDEYKEVTKEAGRDSSWTPVEADILLSKLNYGSDITLTESDLDPKRVLDVESRFNPSDDTNDLYLRRAISAFAYCMNYNLSNGNCNMSPYPNPSESGMLSNVSPDGGMLRSGVNKISLSDVLSKSFLGNYIVTDIEVSRFDIYSIYRQNLAQKHIYASQYMSYNGKKYSDLDDYYIQNNDITILWTEPATNEQQFENLYKPHTYKLKDDIKRSIDRKITEADYSTEVNTDYAKELVKYKRDLARFKKDRQVYDSKNLICYTDAQVTYQGPYNKIDHTVDADKENRARYSYFFNDPGERVTLTNPDKCKIGEEAPISCWTMYSFTKDGIHQNVNFESKNDGSKPIISSSTKFNNQEISNSAVYVELTFTIRVFPKVIGNTLSLYENTNTDGDGTCKRVKVARLIDIELNTD